jgi:hypothetical protein
MESKGAGDALHSPESCRRNEMSDRSRPPFWQIYAHDDELRSPVEASIETVEDAEWYRKKNLTTLRKCEGQELLVHDIEQCCETRPCGRVLCPLCARLYRIWFAKKTLRWLRRSKHHHRPAKTLVVRMKQASNRDLPMVSIGRLQDQLRKRLLRAGIFYVIGGTEVSYNAKDNNWTAHFHLLIFGASDAALKNFAQKCKTDGIPRAVDEPKELKNPVEQITYLQKFSTYYRVGGFDDRGKGLAIPMKRDQMAALAKWTGTHPFEHFLILVGFRRNADGIHLTKKAAPSRPNTPPRRR